MRNKQGILVSRAQHEHILPSAFPLTLTGLANMCRANLDISMLPTKFRSSQPKLATCSSKLPDLSHTDVPPQLHAVLP